MTHLNKFTIQKSFAINAGAGSGKTYTLSRRYVNCVLGFDFFRECLAIDEKKGCYEIHKSYYENLKPAKVNEIVTITYTEAAALEMKERIFLLISKIANFSKFTLNDKDDDLKSIKDALGTLEDYQKNYVNETLKQALKDTSNSRISTIHSFCMDIIKANADLARFDGSLDVAKEYEKDVLIKEAIFEVLNKEENLNYSNTLAKDLNMFLLDDLFAKYLTSSKFRNDFDSFSKTSLSHDELKELLRDLHKIDFVKLRNAADNVIYEFQNKNFPENYIEFIKTYTDSFETFTAKPFANLAKEMGVEINLKKKEFQSIKEEIQILKSFDSFASVYASIDQSFENLFYIKIEILKNLMSQMKQSYDAKLKEVGKIDFDEIIQKASQIAKLAPKNIKYIMVDEFQDTNSLQYQIVKDSMNETTNLFVVGDGKQSIYSFQGAQIEVFNNAIEDKSLIDSIEPMSVNYRSDGTVLKNVNTIFEKILTPNDSINLIKQNYEASFAKLTVSKSIKDNLGSFQFLLTKKDSLEETNGDDETEEENELMNIATFIANVKAGNTNYEHIRKLIENSEKAIAIVFDSSVKMLELKSILNDFGIDAKVSASENFFHTKEITDLFFVLKAISLVSQKNFNFNEYSNFYLAGAYRSALLRFSDNEIARFIKDGVIADELKTLVNEYERIPLSVLIAKLHEKYSLETIYNHLSSTEQRKANFNKFLTMAIEFEKSNGDDMELFLRTLQNNIFFNEHGENEAFFKSENLESIEICTIHSTKGLAYPMVILANSQKGLYGQIQSDSIKNNNFELLNAQTKQIAGFKINGYEPLAFRLLKKIDKLKHIAEKKRLLYVALTRAEHDVVISGTLSKTKKGDISLREDSYLAMILAGLNIDKFEIFDDVNKFCLQKYDKPQITSNKKIPSNIQISLKELNFTNKQSTSATRNNDDLSKDDKSAKLGTVIHKIFELYWNQLHSLSYKSLFDKFEIFDENDKNIIKQSVDNFKNSEILTKLINGAKHFFELEFNHNNKTGFIDLVYYDEAKVGWVIVDFKTGSFTKEKEKQYQKQLDFYENVLIENHMMVVDKIIFLTRDNIMSKIGQ